LAAGAKTLRPYAHRHSPKKYSQPQLFACLVLKTFFKTDYRGLSALLADLSDLRRVLGLRCAPHWTTLHKAAGRLLVRRRVRRLLGFTVRRVLGRRQRVKRAALDSTGFETGHTSHYYARRRTKGASRKEKVRYSRYAKLEAAFDCATT
jgi:hypothetical protein